MAKRKKHQRLPSGWGSIRYLGKGRRNPYAVHPPATEQDPRTGHYIQPKALCYVDDWYVGFAVLNAYRAGTYRPGDELQMKQALLNRGGPDRELDDLVSRITADSGKASRAVATVISEGPPKLTFKEVHDEWFEWKCGVYAAKPPSEGTIKGYRTTLTYLTALFDRPIDAITTDEVQGLINDRVSLTQGTLTRIKGYISMVFDYAEARGLCPSNPVKHVVIPAKARETEKGVPFSIEEIKTLWEHRDDETCELMIIFCYTGHRYAEMSVVDIDLDQKTLTGGVKTATSKTRVVPIHPAVYPLIKRRIEKYGRITHRCQRGDSSFIKKALARLGMSEDHTWHDCRHTFSMLCEKYGIPENDRKRLLGHSFQDITNQTYGHRSVEDLRHSIEMIPWPENL